MDKQGTDATGMSMEWVVYECWYVILCKLSSEIHNVHFPGHLKTVAVICVGDAVIRWINLVDCCEAFFQSIDVELWKSEIQKLVLFSL